MRPITYHTVAEELKAKQTKKTGPLAYLKSWFSRAERENPAQVSDKEKESQTPGR